MELLLVLGGSNGSGVSSVISLSGISNGSESSSSSSDTPDVVEVVRDEVGDEGVVEAAVTGLAGFKPFGISNGSGPLVNLLRSKMPTDYWDSEAWV